MVFELLLILALAIGLILGLILWLRVQAFIALLLASVFVGIASGKMALTEVGNTIVSGMGSSLGFVATIVGLGAIFGAMIEESGGAQSLARGMLKIFGEKRASLAMVLTGFVIAIPVFLDVALVILAPVLYALARKSGKSLLRYGLPLLAGMVVTHSFVPPTPGPTWVAYEFGIPLGTVILYSVMVGLPTALIVGVFLSDRLAEKFYIAPPPLEDGELGKNGPSFIQVALVLLLPILLIVMGSMIEQSVASALPEGLERQARSLEIAKLMKEAPMFQQIAVFFGHPIIALLLSTVLALWVLGKKQGITRERLMEVSTKSLGPAGIIILITGAGGVFKKMLGDSGVGDALAIALGGLGVGPLYLAFLFSAISRIAQGSATVAMVMGASLMAPILEGMDLADPQLSLIVVAIACGAAGFSHVNDSGFWMVSRYLGMTEKDMFKTWSLISTAIALLGMVFASVLWLIV